MPSDEWYINLSRLDHDARQAELERLFSGWQRGLDRDFEGGQRGLDRDFEGGQRGLDRDFEGGQNRLDRRMNMLNFYGSTPTGAQVSQAMDHWRGMGSQLNAAQARAQGIADEGIFNPETLSAMKASRSADQSALERGQMMSLLGLGGGGGAGGRVKAALAHNQNMTGQAQLGRFGTELDAMNAQSQLQGLAALNPIFAQRAGIAGNMANLSMIPSGRGEDVWGRFWDDFEG